MLFNTLEVDGVTMISTAVGLILLGLLLGAMVAWRLGRRRGGSAVDRADAFETKMQTWQRMTKAAEGTLLDNIAATTPWLAPIIPASIAFHNLIAYLDFPFWLAFMSALCIEFLGLAAVHTVFQLWEYNEGKRNSDQPAPFYMGVGVAVSYLVIVLVVNAMLEVTGFETWTWQAGTQVFAKTLLSLLAAVSAFVLAIRSQHARLVSSQAQDKQERRESAELGKLRNLVPQLQQTVHDLQQQVQQVERDKTAVVQQANERETALLARVREVEQERDAALQAVTEADTAVQQIETLTQQLEQAQRETKQKLAEMEQVARFWNALPPEVQAAVLKKVNNLSYREAAEQFNLDSHTIVTRRYKTLFGSNGAGH